MNILSSFPVIRSPLSPIFLCVLLYITYIDLRERRIPNIAVLPAAAVAIIESLLGDRWLSALLGGLVGTIIFVIPILIYGSNRAGVGDVKLALFLGLWFGLPGIVWIIMYAGLIGGVLILARKLRGTYDPNAMVPVAPFLAAGTFVDLIVSFIIS